MTNIVIPVKNPPSAKQRLGELLSPSQRQELALAMLDHVISAVTAARAPRHVLVVTDSPAIEERVSGRGVTVLREVSARGETQAVEEATRWSIQQGFRRQVVIPADLPFITPEDIDTLLAMPLQSPSVVLCPASGDDGTNAIMTSPPDCLTYRFGLRSFPDYVEQARLRGVPCRIVRLPRLVLDLDSFEDVKTFLDEATEGPVLRLLTEWRLHERVH